MKTISIMALCAAALALTACDDYDDPYYDGSYYDGYSSDNSYQSPRRYSVSCDNNRSFTATVDPSTRVMTAYIQGNNERLISSETGSGETYQNYNWELSMKNGSAILYNKSTGVQRSCIVN